jgi:hypothetical protein
LGGKFGDVAYFSKPMTSRHGFLTANDVTPYAIGAFSCKGDPLIIEIPPAGDKASWFGTIVDAWDTPIADVGPPGDDNDADGALFSGDDIYKLNVPADTPAKDFWSVIVYSMKTKGFVEDVGRVGLSSQVMDFMKKNSDGSVDVYFAPNPPAGLESNWIPTGEDFFLLFRLYGPDKPLFEKTWTLGDVEKVN